MNTFSGTAAGRRLLPLLLPGREPVRRGHPGGTTCQVSILLERHAEWQADFAMKLPFESLWDLSILHQRLLISAEGSHG